jgi:hypothetical protein
MESGCVAQAGAELSSSLAPASQVVALQEQATMPGSCLKNQSDLR